MDKTDYDSIEVGDILHIVGTSNRNVLRVESIVPAFDAGDMQMAICSYVEGDTWEQVDGEGRPYVYLDWDDTYSGPFWGQVELEKLTTPLEYFDRVMSEVADRLKEETW